MSAKNDQISFGHVTSIICPALPSRPISRAWSGLSCFAGLTLFTHPFKSGVSDSVIPKK